MGKIGIWEILLSAQFCGEPKTVLKKLSPFLKNEGQRQSKDNS